MKAKIIISDIMNFDEVIQELEYISNKVLYGTKFYFTFPKFTISKMLMKATTKQRLEDNFIKAYVLESEITMMQYQQITINKKQKIRNHLGITRQDEWITLIIDIASLLRFRFKNTTLTLIYDTMIEEYNMDNNQTKRELIKNIKANYPKIDANNIFKNRGDIY